MKERPASYENQIQPNITELKLFKSRGEKAEELVVYSKSVERFKKHSSQITDRLTNEIARSH